MLHIDVYNHIFKDLSITDLISLYNTNKSYHNELNKSRILQQLSQQFELNTVKTFPKLVHEYNLNAIKIARWLSWLYHSGFGFTEFTDNVVWLTCCDENNEKHDHDEYDSGFIKYLLCHFIPVYNKTTGLPIKLNQLKDGENYYIKTDEYIQFCKQLSHTILTYKHITIKLKYEWESKPTIAWYNELQKGKFKAPLLPPLKTRNYIKVLDPFMVVTLDADKKGSDLTINDLLFATRALAIDMFRWVGFESSYKILKNQGHILVLEANIDN